MEDKIVPIIIPSLEPDDRLTQLVRALAEAKLGPIILVDDGSGEDYRARFAQCCDAYGCILLRHAVNLGKGRALKTAFNYCLNTWPGLAGCVTADSDGQHTPHCIERVRNALLASPESLVLGVRDFDAPGVPDKSRLGNKITCRVCAWTCGVKVSDTQTGLRAVPAAFMRHLMNVPGERFEFETRMLIETKERCAICETPIETVYDSKENHTTHFNAVRDSIRIYRVLGAQLGRFLVSSLGSSVLDLLLFWLLCGLLRGKFFAYVAAATAGARICSAGVNYLLNYSLVFRSDAGRARSAVRYVVLAVCQMCVSAALVTAAVSLLPPGTPELCVKLPIDLVLFFLSYVIQREFVYKKNQI
ncbi:MAG: glycosyltransferase [Subdoligranulum sp.]|nr:glycosyltransferase [Subdoligranulum sp.]